MEILELLWVLTQACGCFLEVMAVGSNVGAGVAAVKVRRAHRAEREARARGEAPPPNYALMAVLVVLLFAAFFFTGLVFWKWSSALH